MSATTPCPKCGKPTRLEIDESGKRMILDDTVRVYGNEFDPEERVSFWTLTAKSCFAVRHSDVCKERP